MYMICYYGEDNKKEWDIISGEDEMHVFVNELVDAGREESDIFVFSMEDEIK